LHKPLQSNDLHNPLDKAAHICYNVSAVGDKPTTIVVSTRLDIRDLAALATYLSEVNRLPQTKSMLIRTGVECLVSLLIRDGLIEPIETHGKAFETMIILGLAPGKRNKKNLMNEISKEATAEGLFPKMDEGLEVSFE